ncbi:preprotein translocase subunit SecE [Muricoccus nepalensis]|nr:preprotein translocase subunit SecE [Roseomonas nepalensis]
MNAAPPDPRRAAQNGAPTMAEAKQTIDFEEVKSKDIIADRQTGWAQFTRAASWAVVIIVLLLVALKFLFG